MVAAAADADTPVSERSDGMSEKLSRKSIS